MRGERGTRAWWWGVASGLLLLASVLRLYGLEPKPLHHDESLHAFYSWQLFTKGTYGYDPMLHGPLLYYQIALAYRLFGVSDAAARFFPAVGGVGLTLLMSALVPQLRARGTLVAIALAATSPLLVYVSRFARHDMWSLLCTLLLIVCTLRYRTERRSVWLYGAALALAVSFANHELTYITAAVWALSAFLASGMRLRRIASWMPLRTHGPHLLFAGTLAAILIVVFYSSLYRNPMGALKALPNPFDPGTALGYWVVQHGVHRAGQPAYYYLLLLTLYESLPFALGVAGALIGLRSVEGAWRFVSWMTLLTLTAYSLAGERMPWLTIHPLLPLILSASFLVDRLTDRFSPRAVSLAVAPFGLYVAFAMFNAVRLAFWNPANPIEMAVYTQSQPGLKRELQRIAALRPLPSVSVDQRISWPTAWYLRDLPLANYVRRPVKASLTMTFVPPQAEPSGVGAPADPFNAWWTPPSGWPGFRSVFDYYLFRRIWGRTGCTRYRIVESDVRLR